MLDCLACRGPSCWHHKQYSLIHVHGDPQAQHGHATQAGLLCFGRTLFAEVQDIVARRGKFWLLYKRSGHRVIINMRGDLIVRPSFAEANVQRIPGGEISNITFC